MSNKNTVIDVNDLQLNVVQAGPEQGPLVILLHGFPEFSYAWRYQIPALAEAGYRVWAPDQRGYNLSSKPAKLKAYALDELASDVVGLMDAAGVQSAHVVGHDWGGVVAWWTAIRYPQRVQRLVVMNVPHPAVMRRHLLSNFKQLRKSWYMFFFQLPVLPEWLARRKEWKLPAVTLKGTSRRGTFNTGDLRLYKAAWAQPGAYKGMLNWYRAMFRTRPERVDSNRVTMPVRILWGVHDKFLSVEMARDSLEFCDAGELKLFEDATHWLQHEEPERVNTELLEFLQK